MPAVTVNGFAVPAVKPLYCPEAGSLTESEGVETIDSVLTVQELPVVVTVIVTLVPVVTREDDVDVETSVRHCVSAAAMKDAKSSMSANRRNTGIAAEILDFSFPDIDFFIYFQSSFILET